MANRSTPGRTDKRDDGVAHIGLDEIGAGERYVMELVNSKKIGL